MNGFAEKNGRVVQACPIGVMGVGRMGTSLVRGLLEGRVASKDLLLFDACAAACETLVRDYSVEAVSTPVDLIQRCRTVVLAVKPKDFESCVDSFASHLTGEHLLVSIAAGIRLSGLAKRVPCSTRLIRVMPNVAASVFQAASAYCLGQGATEEDAKWVEFLLSGVGLVVRVGETEMDAVTGLSGSGPAFAMVIIDAMADAGVLEGLPRDVALRLASQTLIGAGTLVLQTGRHPGQLKDDVASPGGTTARGLRALEIGGLRAALMRAVSEATERSRELSR